MNIRTEGLCDKEKDSPLYLFIRTWRLSCLHFPENNLNYHEIIQSFLAVNMTFYKLFRLQISNYSFICQEVRANITFIAAEFIYTFSTSLFVESLKICCTFPPGNLNLFHTNKCIKMRHSWWYISPCKGGISCICMPIWIIAVPKH